MPELPWVGAYLRVNADRSVEWVRCVVCRRTLKTPESRATGIGPVCADQTSDQVAEQLREDCREEDRRRWRRGAPSWDDPRDAPPRIPKEHERLDPSPPVSRPWTEDEWRRWETFTAAMARRPQRGA